MEQYYIKLKGEDVSAKRTRAIGSMAAKCLFLFYLKMNWDLFNEIALMTLAGAIFMKF